MKSHARGLRKLDPADVSAIPGRAPFIGRVAELRDLKTRLAEALAGNGSLFLIGGEAGIGKTRLATEAAHEAARRDALVLWGRCWEGGGAPAYWPWLQIIRGCLRSDDRAGDSIGAARQDLAEIRRDAVPQGESAV